MALMPCPDCGAQMSVTAKACPNCNAWPGGTSSKMPIVLIGAVVLVIAAFVWGGVGRPDPRPIGVIPERAAPTAEERRKEAEFQGMLMVAKSLKDRAKNSSSFQLENAMLMADGSMCFEFLAANSFNAMVREQVVVTEAGATKDAAVWNERCAGKQGKNYTYLRTAL